MSDDDGPGWEWAEQTEKRLWFERRGESLMDARQFTGSKYLRKEDFPQPALLTIREVIRANMARENEPAEYKLVLMFAEREKGMALNISNTDECARIFGSWETDNWLNQRIVVEVDPTIKFAGKTVGGLTVRAPRSRSMGAATVSSSTVSAGHTTSRQSAPAHVERQHTEVDPPPFDDDIPF